MKKLESSLSNMLLVLGGIAIVASALLAWVNILTAEPIRQAEIAKQEKAIKDVTPAFDNSPVADRYEVTLESGEVLACYPAKKGGELQGVAIESYSEAGFNGHISVMVGFAPDGTIYNYSVLKQGETPGLGAKMGTWFKTAKNRQDIRGKNPASENMTVSKDGGSVDAITAATISSRAFLDAVNRAYKGYAASMGIDTSSLDSIYGTTGATRVVEPLNPSSNEE